MTSERKHSTVAEVDKLVAASKIRHNEACDQLLLLQASHNVEGSTVSSGVSPTSSIWPGITMQFF
jgi:hypothetical protein